MNEEYTFAPPVSDGRKLVKGADGKWYYEHDEFNSQQSYYLDGGTTSGATATGYTMGTVATGKKFHLRSIVVTAQTATNIVLHNSSATGAAKIAVRAVSGGTEHMSHLDGFVFSTAIFCEFTSAATGVTVSLGGVLDPQQTPGGS